jgi:hypothetical protein
MKRIARARAEMVASKAKASSQLLEIHGQSPLVASEA